MDGGNVVVCGNKMILTEKVFAENADMQPFEITKKVEYICNPDKTDEQIYVSSYACAPETAAIDFKYTLDHCRENSPNKAYHLIQAFAPGEEMCIRDRSFLMHPHNRQLISTMNQMHFFINIVLSIQSH